MTDSKQLRYQQRKNLSSAEVGSIPAPKNKPRRTRCRKNLEKFLKTYMPHLFSRPFSPDQKEAIGKIQRAMMDSGQFAEAMPRGTGKTTIVEGAIIWGTAYAHRKFPVVIGSDQRAAESILRDIKVEFETNDLLADDFPEICLPVRHIDGRGQRCATQTVDGERTRIEWKAGKMVFPTIKGSKSSGINIEARGLTSGVRGMKNGSLRPDFVLLDDPQTRESAESASQTQKRTDIILGDVMGLAGHDKRISAVMPCTVIRQGDLADTFLDIQLNPEWQGHRTPLVYQWSESESHWEDYHKIWQEEQSAGRGIVKATEFYVQHRDVMDNGARVTCPHLYDKSTEASAIQHAYNLLYTVGEHAFSAEYQNDPKAASSVIYEITPEIVRNQLNGLAKFEIPESAGIVTGFADINYIGLNWALCGFSNDFTGYVATYGKYPAGKKVLYDPKSGEERDLKIYEGLTKFFDRLAAVELKRTNSKESVQIDRFMVDCGAGWMSTVFQWIRINARKYPFPIIASRGWGFSQYKQVKVIGRAGDNWHKTEFTAKGRVISHNADYWRMKTQKAILLPAGSPASLSIYGENPLEHVGISEEVCGEILTDYAETDKGPMYKWYQRPGTANDKLDALVGCVVGAASCGASHVPSVPKKKRKSRKRIGYAKI